MKSQDVEYTIAPLTEDKSAIGGNIVWVHDSDPVAAIRAMYHGLSRPPANVAVWTAAQKNITPDTRREIEIWRKNNFTRTAAACVGRVNTRHEDKRSGQISRVFNTLSSFRNHQPKQPVTMHRINGIFRDHVMARANSIVAATGCKSMALEIRACPLSFTESLSPPHIDGPSSGKLRMIETLYGPETLIAPLDSVATGNKGRNPVYSVPARQHWTLMRIPAGSMIMITNTSHRWAPIAHATPFTIPGKKPHPRVVAVYDIA